MAAKKKTKRKQTKKAASPKKKLAKKKAAPKRKAIGKGPRAAKKRVRGKSQAVDTVVFSPEGLAARSGGQAGDLQGLSSREAANSESVDELLEEGNAFEAGAVKGVQDAGDAEEREVRAHEVPEDDVPGEYRDKEE